MIGTLICAECLQDDSCCPVILNDHMFLKPIDEAAYFQNQSFTGLFRGSRSNSWHRSRFVIYRQIHLTAVILSRIDGFDTYNLDQAILPENIIHARGMEEISKDCDKYTQRSKDGCVPAALPDFLSERLQRFYRFNRRFRGCLNLRKPFLTVRAFGQMLINQVFCIRFNHVFSIQWQQIMYNRTWQFHIHSSIFSLIFARAL